jgi:hypothetical protein
MQCDLKKKSTMVFEVTEIDTSQKLACLLDHKITVAMLIICNIYGFQCLLDFLNAFRSVSAVPDYRLDDRGSISGRGK